MSIRDLTGGECGASNQLMRLGAQVARDAAFKDEGFSSSKAIRGKYPVHQDDFVSEFLGQVSVAPAPPQTFRMDTLLKEMREIDAANQQVIQPNLIQKDVWTKEFMAHQDNFFDQAGPSTGNQLVVARPAPAMHQTQSDNVWVQDFFQDEASSSQSEIPPAAQDLARNFPIGQEKFQYSQFLDFVNNVGEGKTAINDGQVQGADWAKDFSNSESWLNDFQNHNQQQAEDNEKYNKEFWNRLQEEWKKISEENDEGHPWLSDFTNFYDPYKEYNFDENNPVDNIENAFEKGKQFLAQGDIPSAVLCFEAAVKQHPDNAEYWEYLGTSQAENEKDPNAIAALKKSLDLMPNNPKVLMALAVSFTNESLQNQALKMLILWLKNNPAYNSLTANLPAENSEESLATSLIRGPELVEVQNLFLKAVQMTSPNVDPELQEALGVLFNLSSEYDKAVDCFQAAAHTQPNNAKTWNRLGASLANGNRSVEAVEAYQRALEIEPGFIRARYNVGIICINLKAYREAVEHFLTALNHQANSTSRSGLRPEANTTQMSDTIWSTLRMAISLMGRHDLQPAIDNRNLNALNQAFSNP